MADRSIFDMAARLHDFEPFHIANGFLCAGDGMIRSRRPLFTTRIKEGA